MRLNGTGENEFYDLKKDLVQNNNLHKDPQYATIIEELNDKLTDFFNIYTDKNMIFGKVEQLKVLYKDHKYGYNFMVAIGKYQQKLFQYLSKNINKYYLL